MKSLFSLILLACATLGLGQGLLGTENNNSSAELVRRLDPHCNPGNLDPLLPHGPYLCGFPNQNIYNIAARGVLDALELALAALRVLGRCGDEGEEASLTRYFDIGMLSSSRSSLSPMLVRNL